MYRKVLVPLDGSALSSAVLPHVSELARCSGAEVLLLHATPEATHLAATTLTLDHVLEPDRRSHVIPEADTVTARVWGSGFKDHGADGTRAVEAAQRSLDAVAADLVGHGVKVHTLVAPDHVAATILDVAEREGVDLIAMSTHGRSGIGRFLLGSVADQVVHHANVPVLLVRAAAETAPRYRRILVPLDGSEIAHAVLPHARGIAACTNAEVVLLQVVPQPRLPIYDSSVTSSWSGVSPGELIVDGEVTEKSSFDRERRDVAHLEEVAEVHLAQVAVGLEHAGIRVKSVVQVGASAETILDFVKAEHIDLVAMSTHGRSGLQRFRMGSVADRVVRHAGVPVLVVRAISPPG